MRKHVLGKLHVIMGYGAIDHEFNVDKSTVYIKSSVFKQKHT
jgi:hypothetical protein